MAIHGLSATAHINVGGDVRPEYHCSHSTVDQTHSLAIVGGDNADQWTTPSVYLTGTLDDLRLFALLVLDVVAAKVHDEMTEAHR